jgi:hypothetical protein
MPDAPSHWPDVRDKPAFLRRMMSELAGDDTRMSLEGDLSRCWFPESLVLGRDELGPLRRGTLYPRQDFIVLRLTPEAVGPIFEQASAAGLTGPIIHVQIERSGVLELGAYDNFHPECTVTGPGVSAALLDELKRKGVLRDFRVAEDRHR